MGADARALAAQTELVIPARTSDLTCGDERAALRYVGGAEANGTELDECGSFSRGQVLNGYYIKALLPGILNGFWLVWPMLYERLPCDADLMIADNALDPDETPRNDGNDHRDGGRFQHWFHGAASLKSRRICSAMIIP
jgi:hypothetical protein